MDQTSNTAGDRHQPDADPPRELTPAASRALAEADERRKRLDGEREAAAKQAKPREVGGASGPEPVRYGDWEKGGIASDF